ncbi:DNA (cytosine-5)-methyltransferase 1 [Thermocatellispora tengchongensis]|uniref:Cytosine-specific methyltransferase n=1 Tax=Thermocatellispora tengchongensis TaxID=1073253 RepID=A0A840P4T3_9ACTN|nr:DNA cytosine methyltransferase [Thermocatellispora tengchongensis]MBB5132871.1 DNA (cytosine-5)-methyltransferase 1 [Thermocatellispora tengchongensis]
MTGLLTAGSLCSGYGGLDLAVHAVLGTRLLWAADNDPDAARVLAARFPDVPNLGDLTAIDWDTVPPVDVLTAGFPCQDLSYAGRGAGITKGTRSGLWHTIADAVATLRPRLLVLENVRAIVTRRPGLDVVLADLARLGFDANWTCLRASDLGAAHERKRWFCLAWPAADTGRTRRQGGRLPGATAERVHLAADAAHFGHQRGGVARRRGDGPSYGGLPATADPDRSRRRTDQHDLRQRQSHAERRGVFDWGPYGPAVARWEATIGHPPPWPVEPGRHGRPRLSPRFSEWLMGLPAGWVTDVPGISRTGRLRLVGNGVVPLQGPSPSPPYCPNTCAVNGNPHRATRPRRRLRRPVGRPYSTLRRNTPPDRPDVLERAA